MLTRPAPGTRVVLAYRMKDAPLRGRRGVVLAAARGPGPRNHLVRLDDGTLAVVPAGHLRKEG